MDTPAMQQATISTASYPLLPAAAKAALDSSDAPAVPVTARDATALSSTTAAVKGCASTADQRHAEQLSKSTSCTSVGGKKVQRPAWALTADAGQDAEQQEEEELLAFAGGLEFDRYIAAQEDAELQEVLQVSTCEAMLSKLSLYCILSDQVESAKACARKASGCQVQTSRPVIVGGSSAMPQIVSCWLGIRCA